MDYTSLHVLVMGLVFLATSCFSSQHPEVSQSLGHIAKGGTTQLTNVIGGDDADSFSSREIPSQRGSHKRILFSPWDKCSQPPDPPNAQFNCGARSKGVVCNMKCDDGLIPAHSYIDIVSAICSPSGSWSNREHPGCVRPREPTTVYKKIVVYWAAACAPADDITDLANVTNTMKHVLQDPSLYKACPGCISRNISSTCQFTPYGDRVALTWSIVTDVDPNTAATVTANLLDAVAAAQEDYFNKTFNSLAMVGAGNGFVWRGDGVTAGCSPAYTATLYRLACAACGVGYESNGAGGCQACPVNTYQDDSGDGSCIKCPPGTHTLAGVINTKSTDCRSDDPPSASSPMDTLLQHTSQKRFVFDSSGPNFTNCPDNIQAYADRGKRSTKVTWDDIRATDSNSGNVTVTQVKGQPSGSTFTEGAHEVYFEAVNSAGQKDTCYFMIRVDVLPCFAPYVMKDVDLKPNCGMDVSYGSVCPLFCQRGRIQGAKSMVCEKRDHKMVWEFLGPEPSCVGTVCSKPGLPPGGSGWNCSNDYKFNSVCGLECAAGYQTARNFDGSEGSIQCIVDGTWIGRAQCIADVGAIMGAISEQKQKLNSMETMLTNIMKQLNSLKGGGVR